jgi:hypothetical protein
MVEGTAVQRKLRIAYALGDRLAPMACSIKQNIINSTRLIEDLPAVAIEALLDHARDNHSKDNPKDEVGRLYKELRRGFIAYGEACLRQAMERERRLLEGITGLDGVA